jgi:hypothetical protein
VEEEILRKCGWSDKNLDFLGTLVFNIQNKEGVSIADLVSNRTSEQVSIEWFVPNKEGDRIAIVYSLSENKIVKEKTDSEIISEKDLGAFLDTIENSIKGQEGYFFPKSKLGLALNKKNIHGNK